MKAEKNAVPVTIVSTDVPLLRELSWTLSAFGYDVNATTDWSDEAPWRWATRPGILILDPPPEPDADRAAAARRGGPFQYRIAIQRDPTDAMYAGRSEFIADDVLRRPLKPSETLSRLRAGVRRLEFERRLVGQSLEDPATGLMSRAGFLRQAAATLPGRERDAGILVLFGVDHFDQLLAEHGRHAAEILVGGLTRTLENESQARRGLFIAAPGIVGVCLSEHTREGAQSTAERVTQAFSRQETVSRQVRCCPTVSAAIVPWDDADALQCLDRCEQALAQARCFGGGQVVRADEVEQDVQQWRRGVEDGSLFKHVVAQDVMEAFPLTLSEPASEQHAAAQWLRSASEQGRPLPQCLPVVDHRGRLAGVCQLGDAQDCGDGPLLVTKAATVPAGAPLAEVLDAFAKHSSACLVVTQDDAPLGYVVCDALTELFTEQIDAQRYRPEAEGASAGGLVVPLSAVAADCGGY